MALLSLLVTAVLSIYVDHIFKIPPELHSTARWLLLMVGASVGIGFPLGVVGGYLDGLQRFYVNNWANIAGDIARLVLIILSRSATDEDCSPSPRSPLRRLLLSAIRGIVAYRIRPVPFGFKYVNRATFRTIVNYSSVTLIIMIATQLKFKSDNVVIATMISAAAVTYFSIGARIVSYAQQVVMALAQNFLPHREPVRGHRKHGSAAQSLCGRQPLLRFYRFPDYGDAADSGQVGDRGVGRQEIRRHQLSGARDPDYPRDPDVGAGGQRARAYSESASIAPGPS